MKKQRQQQQQRTNEGKNDFPFLMQSASESWLLSYSKLKRMNGSNWYWVLWLQLCTVCVDIGRVCRCLAQWLQPIRCIEIAFVEDGQMNAFSINNRKIAIILRFYIGKYSLLYIRSSIFLLFVAVFFFLFCLFIRHLFFCRYISLRFAFPSQFAIALPINCQPFFNCQAISN